MDKKYILLVDDEQEILDLYSVSLKRNGFEVATASNGQEAITEAKKRKPDLIIMDLKMPVMNGAEALSKLREDPALRDIKVIFITAFSDPAFVSTDSKFAKEVGAISFIKKGILLEEFIEEVKKGLQ